MMQLLQTGSGRIQAVQSPTRSEPTAEQSAPGREKAIANIESYDRKQLIVNRAHKVAKLKRRDEKEHQESGI